MALPLIALGAAAVPAAGSLFGAIRQNNEAKRLKERGPEGLPPSVKKALNRAKIQANASVTPSYTAEKQIIDENVADATEVIRKTSGNAAEVISGVQGVTRQRGEALQRLMKEDQARKDDNLADLSRKELFAGQIEQRNRDIYQQDLMNLLRSRDANVSNAVNRLASVGTYGLQEGYFDGLGKKDSLGKEYSTENLMDVISRLGKKLEDNSPDGRPTPDTPKDFDPFGRTVDYNLYG